MKWSHLPVDGGLYDQDPDLLDKFEYMFQKIAEEEKRKADEGKRKAEAEQRKNSRGASTRRPRRR